MIITTIPEAEATGVIGEIYAADLADYGYVTPHTKAMSLNPDALHTFEELTDAIASGMGMRRYKLVTLAAAKACHSQHCRLAHGRHALNFFGLEELIAIANDHRDAGLSEAEVAMMDFAARVSTDSSAMTDADSERLRTLGFSDREIVDIALAAAVRNYYGRALHALAVPVDDRAKDLDPRLVEALLKDV